MTNIEKLISGDENIEVKIDYQSFDAKSTTSNKVGTLYEFSIEIESDLYNVRVMHFENEDEIIYSSVDTPISISDDPNALPMVKDMLECVTMDKELFKEKICEFARDIIENL